MNKKILLFLIITFAFSDPFEQMDFDFLKKQSTSTKKEIKKSIKTDKSLPEYSQVVDGLDKTEGLFNFYQDLSNNKVYLSINPKHFETTFLANITRQSGDAYFYDGSSMLGEFPFKFKRIANTIQFIHINVLFRADINKAISKAIDNDFSNSIIATGKVLSMPHPQTGEIIVDASDMFIRDIGYVSQHGGGRYVFDKKNSYFIDVDTFSENSEIEVSIHYKSNKWTGSITLPNSRSMEIKYHISLSAIPVNTFIPRPADDRVGYFMTIYQDYSNTMQETQYVRYINKWNLEKAVSYGGLSEPVEPIVFWIENKVPEEFRDAIKEGVLAWNSAFEKIGFKNAVVVKQMPSDATWDPADARYNTIRWIIQPGSGYAVGPSRANPYTGELYDADIRISADFVRGFFREFDEFVVPVTNEELLNIWLENDDIDSRHECKYASILHNKMSLGWHHLVSNGYLSGSKRELKKYIHDGLVDLVLHEVGHTLGLRHNFKASSIFSINQLSDKNFTNKFGISGSVMDYHPVNLFDGGNTIFQTKPGPYDDWAIEYGYTPTNIYSQDEILENIASKSNHPLLTYGTDEDTFGRSSRGVDPHCSLWDLSNNPINYYVNQLDLVNKLWSNLIFKFKVDGNRYQKIRSVFSQGIGEYVHAGISVPKFIGGIYFHRNHIGDPGDQIPFQIVSPEKQREALKFLTTYIFGKDVFNFDPDLLNMLAPERHEDFHDYAWNLDRIDYPIHNVVKHIHSRSLYSLFHPRRLARIQDNEIKTSVNNPFTMQELFQVINNSIWVELSLKENINSFKRELQKTHINMLSNILHSKSSFPNDAIALSRHILSETLKNIYSVMGNNTFDQYTNAHLENSANLIQTILNANKQIN